MRKIRSFILLLFFVSACLPTVHPLYHASDLIHVKKAESDWFFTEDSKTYHWNFILNPDSKSDDDFKDMYQVTIISASDTAEYAGGFLRLGDVLYLDLYLPDFNTSLPFAKQHLFSVHSIWKVEFDEQTMKIFPFNSKWIRDLIENNQVRIKHESSENGLLITAGTDELQQFVRKYGSDERAFDNPKILIKKPL